MNLEERVINPILYAALERRFGKVRVANQGTGFAGQYEQIDGNRRPKLRVLRGGEQYRVCCPKCHDTNYHLYVSHVWGVPDETGNRRLHLMNCYHGCYQYEDKKTEWEAMFGGDEISPHQLREPDTEPEELAVASPPGRIVPLDQLPRDHAAVEYLECRYFDVGHLSRHYGVGYVAYSTHFLAENRIYIPVHFEGRVVGWQCRLVGESDKTETGKKPPKYYTMPNMPRRLVLYNYDRARLWKTLVVVEGPTDVWSFGPMAVGLLGSQLTSEQISLLKKLPADRSIVYIPDPEELKRASNSLDRYRHAAKDLGTYFRGQVALVSLPIGFDPGSLDRTWLREYVTSRSADQGVRVAWEAA